MAQTRIRKSSLLTILFVLLVSSISLILPAQQAHAYSDTMPALRLPWLFGTHYINGGYSYGCGDHTDSYKDNFAIDFAMPEENVPLAAVFSGTVTTGYDGDGVALGKWISIDRGDGWVATYGHLNNNSVVTSGTVQQGQLIGYSGNTGNSWPKPGGGHLHFRLHKYAVASTTGKSWEGTPGISVKPEPMSGYTGFGQFGRTYDLYQGYSDATGPVCGNKVSPPYNAGPGGWWIAPTPTGGSSNMLASGSRVQLGFRTDDHYNLGVAYVKFSKWTQSSGWQQLGATTSPDSKQEVFSEAFTLSTPMVVGVDVYAKRKDGDGLTTGNPIYQLSPRGVRFLCIRNTGCPANPLAYTDGSQPVFGDIGGSGNSNNVLVCSDANALGTCATFDVGSVADLSSYGLSGNISYVHVPSTLTLVLYDQTGFSGQSGTFNQDISDLGATTNWNDRAKSLKVQQKLDTSCTANPSTDNGIILSRDPDYRTGGGCHLVTDSIPDLGVLGYTRFSSLQFVGSFINTKKVTLYTDANYGTGCGAYTLNQSDLRACAQVDIVSLKVEDYTPPTQANNIAPSAILDHPGAGVTADGNLDTEWVSGNKVPLGFVFTLPRTIQDIVIFDRKQNNPDNNQINKVQLVFSDGTVINDIDMTSGGPRCAEVSFSAKQVSWVNVVPTDASGNNGFSEVQIWDTNGSVYSQNNCVMKYTVTPIQGSGPAPLVSAPVQPQAISLRSVSGDNNGSGGSSLTLTVPTGTANGDVMIAHVIVRQAGNTITAPSGWTLIRRQDSSSSISTATYWKLASSSEPVSYTWSFSASGESSGGIASYFGVDNTNPIDASNTQYNSGTSTVSNSGVTTTTANDMLILTVGITVSTTVNTASGFNEEWVTASSSSTTSEMSDEIYAAVGATGAIQASHNGGSNSNITHLIALKPAGSGSLTNLALHQPAVSSSNESSSYMPANAFDGDTTTRWSSASSDPQWIYVDLGATYNITQVTLNWETAYGSAYQIQVSSDANTWTSVYTTTTGIGGVNTLTNLSGTGRYVRMYGTQRGTQWGYSLWEFAVYGTPSQTPTPTPTPSSTATPTPTPTSTTDVLLSQGQPIVSSSEKSGYTASNANDGSIDTYWEAQDNTYPASLTIDLGSVKSIDKVVLEVNWGTRVENVQILVSSDNTTFTSIVPATNYSLGTVPITFTATNARYVRIVITSNDSAPAAQMAEFQVWGH